MAENPAEEKRTSNVVLQSISEEEIFRQVQGIPGAVMRDNPGNVGFIKLDREDIHQELLLETVRAIRSYLKKSPETPDGLSTYIYRACELRLKELTRQQNFDKYRADATSVAMEAVFVNSDESQANLPCAISEDSDVVLTNVLLADLCRCLSDRQISILEGLKNSSSFSEIARDLKISRNAVRYHALQIGLKAPWLREALKET